MEVGDNVYFIFNKKTGKLDTYELREMGSVVDKRELEEAKDLLKESLPYLEYALENLPGGSNYFEVKEFLSE